MQYCANFLNADGTCFPSRKTISKCGNFSISTYNKYVSVMLLENVLEKENQSSKKTAHRPVIYLS